MTPQVSIVVPSRGGAQRLPHLVAALRAQTEPSWEAVVVLDGDIDDSAGVLATRAGDLPVRTIVFDQNQGRSAALNAGFAAATGEVLVRCDDDLRPASDFVAAHLARHRAGRVGVVGLYRNVLPDTAYARRYGQARDQLFRDEAYRRPADQRWRYWAGNVSVTREDYDRVGPYDTTFRAYGWEDVDWGYRLHRTGCPVVLAPELETEHHLAAVTTELRVTRAFHSGAARARFLAKHGPDALGASAPGGGVWNALVTATSRRAGLARLQAWARHADRTIDRRPAWFAEKQVSWLVESAARSGELRPEEVSTSL